ncbi:MAG: hypothetical protein QOG42_2034 [Solirubrobacteraceae bacterium]|jgi:hypothetical protein|nr:hypothetical protein [Solirubrobacteraceae bacterium]
MAILSIELEESRPAHPLIRITTVDDTIAGAAPVNRPFADPQAAADYLTRWIEEWLRAADSA